MSDVHREPQPYQLMVVELDDVVPRIKPDKPNLYLAKTVSNPKDRFEVIQRSKKQRWYSSHVLQLRLDLTLSGSYATSQEATAAMKELKKKLRKDGYTVNRDKKGVERLFRYSKLEIYNLVINLDVYRLNLSVSRP